MFPKLIKWFCAVLLFGLSFSAYSEPEGMSYIDHAISQNPGLSGIQVLDKGEESLLARAWMVDHAQVSIDVQYFIWSTDNIGILASEALLRAAKRGVKVRVIVDDLLIDAPDMSLLALALHPNIDIKIYNPKHSVGVSFWKRIYNIVTDFRSVNQRMHDKTFIVDSKAAITGGRNMADEYYDFNHTYNFRDRDVLVLGPVVKEVKRNFDAFWQSPLSVAIKEQYKDADFLPNHVFGETVSVDNKAIQQVYTDLHRYADNRENFEPEVRQVIETLSSSFESWSQDMVWAHARFISDKPGKNKTKDGLGGGGLSTTALAELIAKASKSITIQSPYLVLSTEAEDLFRQAVLRGVKIKICTNSLASTDNLQAFSGYRNQRQALLDMGLEVYEYKPHPNTQLQLLKRYHRIEDKQPIFAIHAKSMVVDSETVYIGTYNLDPRSQNLNTEVGIIVTNTALAQVVEDQIQTDMAAENSWPATASPDQYAGWGKRAKVYFWQWMPLKPLL